MKLYSFLKPLKCTAQAQRSYSPTIPFTAATRSRNKPSQAQQLLQGFKKAWLKKLVLEQIHVEKVTTAAEQLAHRAEHDHLHYYQKLHAAMDKVTAPLELSKQQQDVLGVAELQGPVLDPTLLNNSLTLSSQDTLQLYPLHARSSTASRASARMRGASSSAAADSSSRKGTAGSSRSSSSKRGRKKRNELQQVDVPAEPAQDDMLLARMANSIQQANSLLRCNDNLYRTAVDGVDGLLETPSDLDKQAEDAYNLLMAVRSPEPQPATAVDTAQQQEPQQQGEAEPEEQLFAVYLPNTAGSASSSKQFVQLLRLPEQAWQYDYAQQRGMLVVPLQGASQQPGDGSHAVSAEELAWQEQQEHLYEREQKQQDIFFGWTPVGMDVSTGCSENSDSTDASSESSDDGEDSRTQSSSDSDNQASCVSRIKVDVHIHIPTRPGQEVVLVGSHPQLGSWSMDGAVPLKWSDGHVWRTSIELPADCSSFEYKAVLRSSDGAVWEAGDNRQANLQGSDSFTLQHTFRCC